MFVENGELVLSKFSLDFFQKNHKLFLFKKSYVVNNFYSPRKKSFLVNLFENSFSDFETSGNFLERNLKQKSILLSGKPCMPMNFVHDYYDLFKESDVFSPFLFNSEISKFFALPCFSMNEFKCFLELSSKYLKDIKHVYEVNRVITNNGEELFSKFEERIFDLTLKYDTYEKIEEKGLLIPKKAKPNLKLVYSSD